MSKLVLVDGSGFIYRSFYALPPLKKSDGSNVGAVYGFTNMLISILTNNSLEYFAIIFDKGKKNFRHEIYPEYKQTRRETPEELIPQFSIVREACSAFNIDFIEYSGFEADDIIATYAKKAINKGYKVKVISGDKDLTQLIEYGIEIYDPIKTKSITNDDLLIKYGVTSSNMRDFLALSGDTSDNVPGVPGIGPKTAASLLNDYKSLEGIYENINNITKKKLKENLEIYRDQAFMSQKLVTLNDKAPYEIEIENLNLKPLDKFKIQAFLEKNEFFSMIKKLEHLKFSTQNTEVKNYTFNDVIQKSINTKYIIITENYIKTENITADITQTNFYKKNAENNLLLNQNYLILKQILENKDILKITNNAKSLFNITENISNYDDISIMNHITYGKSNLENMNLSYEMYSSLKEKMKHSDIYNLYETIYKPFIKVIFEIEKIGMLVDPSRMKKLKTHFLNRINEIEKLIFETAGKKFNIGSTKQLGEILFETLKIPFIKRNKKSGNYATDQSVLEELSTQGYNIADYILEWRQISKLNSTYTDSITSKLDKNNRIHTTLNITGTNTGRLSSTDPNLQNIPVKTEEGKQIRNTFISGDGNILISFDYSQIELRILAEISGSRFLQDAFLKNIDIHSYTASKLFNVNILDITDELRRRAKAINFGIIYGMQSFTLAKRTNMSFKGASEFINSYFEINPEVKEYIDNTKKFAEKHGYVETILKRRCNIPNSDSRNYILKSAALRQAINAPIQGSSADIITNAMVQISKESLPCNIIMQIHDELIIETNEQNKQEITKRVKTIMENSNIIKIPLIVNVSSGHSWSEL